MAGSVMLNAKILMGGYNFSGIHNSVALEYGAEMLDETVFQAGVNTNTRKNKAGLKTFTFNGNVFWDSDVDSVMFSRIGGTVEVMTFANTGETEGDIVFITKGMSYTYNPISGEVGGLLQGTVNGSNSNTALIRGVLMKNGTVTTTVSTTGLNIGSLSGKKIAAALHIFSPLVAGGGGEQVIVTVESDDNSGFTTPTTRLTHATKTAYGSDWQDTTLGVVTDAYWRTKFTVAGASPSFLLVHSFGWVA